MHNYVVYINHYQGMVGWSMCFELNLYISSYVSSLTYGQYTFEMLLFAICYLHFRWKFELESSGYLIDRPGFLPWAIGPWPEGGTALLINLKNGGRHQRRFFCYLLTIELIYYVFSVKRFRQKRSFQLNIIILKVKV